MFVIYRDFFIFFALKETLARILHDFRVKTVFGIRTKGLFHKRRTRKDDTDKPEVDDF